MSVLPVPRPHPHGGSRRDRRHLGGGREASLHHRGGRPCRARRGQQDGAGRTSASRGSGLRGARLPAASPRLPWSYPLTPVHHRNLRSTRAGRPQCGDGPEEDRDMTAVLPGSAARPHPRPGPALLTSPNSSSPPGFEGPVRGRGRPIGPQHSVPGQGGGPWDEGAPPGRIRTFGPSWGRSVPPGRACRRIVGEPARRG